MKKLNKFQIDSEKIMESKELMTLRGGYGLNGACCYCWNPTGRMAATSASMCESNCNAIGATYTWYC